MNVYLAKTILLNEPTFNIEWRWYEGM